MLNYKVLKRDNEAEIFQINVNEDSKNIGIGEENPKATLDINGNLRIQDIKEASDDTSSLKRLVVDDKGIIYSISYNSEDEKQSNKTNEATLNAGNHITFHHPNNPRSINIILEFYDKNGERLVKSVLTYNGTKITLKNEYGEPNYQNIDSNGIKYNDILTSIIIDSSGDNYNIKISNNWTQSIKVKYKITS